MVIPLEKDIYIMENWKNDTPHKIVSLLYHIVLPQKNNNMGIVIIWRIAS